jgi:DedD protein
MDQDLKQRLIGAVVITSLAAIFVPMLFDDPIDETGKMISELKIPDSPVRKLTGDSGKLPGSIDEVINLPDPLPLKEKGDNPRTISGMQRWFLQVGIFGQESNAISLKDKIRKQGFSVSIMTVADENGSLYRVRVGPELDKKRAELLKIKIDKLNNIKSILTLVDE